MAATVVDNVIVYNDGRVTHGTAFGNFFLLVLSNLCFRSSRSKLMLRSHIYMI